MIFIVKLAGIRRVIVPEQAAMPVMKQEANRMRQQRIQKRSVIAENFTFLGCLHNLDAETI